VGRTKVVLLVALVVLVVDQLTKAWVVARLEGRDPIRLPGGLVSLEVVRNSGAAFSLGGGLTVFFSLVAVVVAVVVVRTATRLRSTLWAVALGALLGGAVGNLVDRIVLDPAPLRGAVVDWISPQRFAVFNVADAALTLSAIAIALLVLRGVEMTQADPEPDPAAASNPEGPGPDPDGQDR
jgi:signal peptidase II